MGIGQYFPNIFAVNEKNELDRPIRGVPHQYRQKRQNNASSCVFRLKA